MGFGQRERQKKMAGPMAVDTTKIRNLLQKVTDPSSIGMATRSLQWHITAPQKFRKNEGGCYKDSTGAEYRAYEKAVDAISGPKAYPIMWGSWSVLITFTVRRQSPRGELHERQLS